MLPSATSKELEMLLNASRSSSLGIKEIITEEDEKKEGSKTKWRRNSTSPHALKSAKSGAIELEVSVMPLNLNIPSPHVMSKTGIDTFKNKSPPARIS